MIIAGEARKQTLKNIENGTTKTLEEIFEKISNAMQAGKFSIVVDKLSHDAQKQLEYLGYTIDSGSQYNKMYYKISWRMSYMKSNRTNIKENEVMMIVESINTYKKVLEDTEVNVCTGMTESEKKAYKLGIYNSFAVINDFLDQNLNEDVPHYTVLLRDNIKSEEFTIDDFKKWTESREYGLV